MLTDDFKTPFGHHIVKLDEKHPARQMKMTGMHHVIEVVMLAKTMF